MPLSRSAVPDLPSSAWVTTQWCALCMVYGVCVFLLWGSLEEDSYIFFRVADNLANGLGYVFNPGGERIETGSSPVWQWLLAVAAWLGLPLYTVAKGLGTAAAGVALWQTWQVERLFAKPLCELSSWRLLSPRLLLSPWLLVSSITFLFWSQSGMESVLFTALLLWWARCLLDPSHHRYIALVGVLLYATRPEGFIYLPALLVAWVVVPSVRTGWLRQCAMLVMGIVVFHAARWWYFDDVLPSAFYAKSAFYPVPHWQLYKTWFLRTDVYWLFPFAALALLDRRSVVLCALLYAACYFAVGNPDGKILFRLGLPAISLACLLAAVGVRQLLGTVKGQAVFRSLLLALVLFLMLLRAWQQLTLVELVFYKPQDNPLHSAWLRFVDAPQAFTRDTWLVMRDPSRIGQCATLPVSTCEQSYAYNAPAGIAAWLAENRLPGMVVAGDQMGEIPWRSGADITHLDLFGIADRCLGYANFDANVQKVQGLWFYRDVLTLIQRKPVCHQQDAVNYVFQRKPDVFLLGSVFYQFAPDSFYGRLVADPRFQQDYELRYLIDLTGRVYVKKTLPSFTVPTQVLRVDMPSGQIRHCPEPARLRRYVEHRLLEWEGDEVKWQQLLARCASD